MKNINDKIGIVVSVVVTAIALGFVGAIGASHDGSIQSQGQTVIDRTTDELQNVPDTMQDITSDALSKAEVLATDIPEAVEEIIEQPTLAPEMIENALPEVPSVVLQNEGKLLDLITIPHNTGVPGCETLDECFSPSRVTMSAGGEVIWSNNDNVAHTVTSGNPRDGPDGLFDSGLIMPGDTYSQQLDLAFEYDYFCLVHPWMQGTIAVG